jgi:hypothetical protein
MGKSLNWEDTGPLPLMAFWFAPGENTLVHQVEEGVPLYVMQRGWGDAVLMNAAGEIVRPVTVETYRGKWKTEESVGVNALEHGIVAHFCTCASCSLNEVR